MVFGEQVGEQEVGITISSPPPVDVVIAIAVVAIAHKGMTATRVGNTCIEHRAIVGQFVVDEVVPVGFSVVTALGQLRVAAIVEITSQCRGNV